ncbi:MULTISPECIES: DUF2973 domain-containing protein [Cyanophyceae]|uniref:DUF2973 domain-containing protein n=1 Tax=Cyanophyceae TaxID=3028117 RepID=UPI001689E435|nr:MULTISPECIES: DUF2973 domain-containing protein [Cyanophyceae]MBD1915934.1 DUF2973 domain-containing protein [Phormidium sp. FACHB-77]MBD2030392.1 DUF2973 domain-containing protein [Phormidium sp. FACHB-322]MBD2053394.1 DUF2973 domain-containing protein [Leptolyngbya sp. FACHB-60]
MWHVVYIIAFAVLAIMAIANLVRNLILLGGNARNPQSPRPYGGQQNASGDRPMPHPELLDQDGQVIREPLLVMRSISVKDAREQLDALYNGNGSALDEPEDSGSEPDL